MPSSLEQGVGESTIERFIQRDPLQLVLKRNSTSDPDRPALPDVEESAMWFLFAQPPRPDARYFPGRRALAALDAIGWPAAWFVVVLAIPQITGIMGSATKGLLILIAARRIYRAVLRNERYRFTTVRWGLPVLCLLAFGEVIKIVG